MIQNMMHKDSRDFNHEERTARDTFVRDAERVISISKETKAQADVALILGSELV